MSVKKLKITKALKFWQLKYNLTKASKKNTLKCEYVFQNDSTDYALNIQLTAKNFDILFLYQAYNTK